VYRRDIGDTFLYVCGILKFKTVDLLLVQLREEAAKAVANPARWQPVEAVLFALRRIAEVLDQEEQQAVNPIFELVFQLPAALQSPKVSYTSLLLIGAYSGWLSGRPDSLREVTSFVLAGFEVPELCPAAAVALKDIGEACPEVIQPFLPILISTYLALKPFVRVRERVTVVEMIVGVLQPLSPVVLTSGLQSLLQGNIQALSATMQQRKSKESREQVLSSLRQVAACLKKLKSDSGRPHDPLGPSQVTSVGPHPMSPFLLGSLWPGLEQVVAMWVSDEEILLVSLSPFPLLSSTSTGF